MVLIGSSTAPAARIAVRELPAGLLPVVRFGVAGLLLLPVIWSRRANLVRLLVEDGPRLALAAALCVPINQTFFLNATKLTATSHVGLIYAAVPLVVLFLATISRQEAVIAGRWVGVALSVFGVMVIGLDSLLHGGAVGRDTFNGDLLLIGAVISWGGYLAASKPLIAKHGAFIVLTGTFLVGAFLDIPVAVATYPSWPPLASVSPTAWWAMVYMTLIVTVLGLALQNLAMRTLDASQVATFGNASPVLTVVWGVWLFGEELSPAILLGGALTLAGIYWTNRAPKAAAGRTISEPLHGVERSAVAVGTLTK